MPTHFNLQKITDIRFQLAYQSYLNDENNETIKIFFKHKIHKNKCKWKISYIKSHHIQWQYQEETRGWTKQHAFSSQKSLSGKLMTPTTSNENNSKTQEKLIQFNKKQDKKPKLKNLTDFIQNEKNKWAEKRKEAIKQNTFSNKHDHNKTADTWNIIQKTRRNKGKRSDLPENIIVDIQPNKSQEKKYIKYIDEIRDLHDQKNKQIYGPINKDKQWVAPRPKTATPIQNPKKYHTCGIAGSSNDQSLNGA